MQQQLMGTHVEGLSWAAPGQFHPRPNGLFGGCFWRFRHMAHMRRRVPCSVHSQFGLLPEGPTAPRPCAAAPCACGPACPTKFCCTQTSRPLHPLLCSTGTTARANRSVSPASALGLRTSVLGQLACHTHHQRLAFHICASPLLVAAKPCFGLPRLVSFPTGADSWAVDPSYLSVEQANGKTRWGAARHGRVHHTCIVCPYDRSPHIWGVVDGTAPSCRIQQCTGNQRTICLPSVTGCLGRGAPACSTACSWSNA